MRTRHIIPGFFILLWLASAASLLFSFDFYPKQFENRTWTTWPKAETFLQNPQAYTQTINSYVADQYGLRSSFIRLHNWGKLAVFRTSPNNMVLLGKNGWLFWAGQESLPFYRNVIPFSAEELSRLNTMIEDTQAWLAKRGIPFMVVIPPDPPNVYPQFLPDWFKVEPGKTRRLELIDALNGYMRYPVLDLVPVLQKAETVRPAYHRTDSHWNEWGGFVTVDMLMRQLKVKKASIRWQPERYHFNTLSIPGMDLALIIGMPDLFTDFDYIKPQDYYVKTDIRDVYNFSTFCASCEDKTLLMVMDSYGLNMMPYLSSTYRHVIYVWDNVIPFARIEQEKPDLVMFEFVERKLRGLPYSEVPK